MKILQVLPALEQGGVERGTLEIAAALTAAANEEAEKILSEARGDLLPVALCTVFWHVEH